MGNALSAADERIRSKIGVSGNPLYVTGIPQAPVIGTTEVATIVLASSPSTGYMQFGFTGYSGYTQPIDLATFLALGSANARQDAIQDNLEAHHFLNIGDISTVVESGSTPNFTYTITYGGTKVRRNMPLITAQYSFNQGTLTPGTSVAGVDGSFLGYKLGELIYDVDNGRLFRIIDQDNGYGRYLSGTRPIYTKTADFTILPHMTGCVFDNNGASGTVVFSLPAVASVPLGSEYHFHVATAQALRVDANGTETVSLTTGVPCAAGKYLGSSTQGNALSIRKGNIASNWNTFASAGVWAVEP